MLQPDLKRMAEDVIYAHYARWNSYAVGGVSILLNFFLIYVATKRDLKKWKSGNRTLYFTTIRNIVYSAVHMMTIPAIHVHETSLLIQNTGFEHNIFVGRVLVAAFLFLFSESTVLLSWQFYYRFIVICLPLHHELKRTKAIYLSIGVAHLIVISWTVLAVITMWPNEKTYEEVDIIVYHGLWKQPFLATVYDSVLFKILVVYLAILLSFCCFLMFTATHFINSRIRKNVIAMKTQRELFGLLLIQAFIPLICIHLPLALQIILPVFDMTDDRFLDLLPFAFAWFPFIDAAVIIWRIGILKIFFSPNATTISTFPNSKERTRTRT